MSGVIQSWLAKRASPPGMLAVAARNPAGQVTCHGVDPTFAPEKMEAIINHFDGLQAAILASRIEPRWSTWTFGRGQVRFITRADGWLLALAARADSQALSRLDALSQEFLELDLGAL